MSEPRRFTVTEFERAIKICSISQFPPNVGLAVVAVAEYLARDIKREGPTAIARVLAEALLSGVSAGLKIAEVRRCGRLRAGAG